MGINNQVVEACRYWCANDRSFSCFTYNYHYPELDPALNEAQQQTHVLKEVNDLYGPALLPDGDKTFRPIDRTHIPAGEPPPNHISTLSANWFKCRPRFEHRVTL